MFFYERSVHHREAGALKIIEPRLALEIGRHRRVLECLRGGNVGLELDRVRAAVRRKVDELHCVAEAAIVHRADLGDGEYGRGHRIFVVHVTVLSSPKIDAAGSAERRVETAAAIALTTRSLAPPSHKPTRSAPRFAATTCSARM